MKKKVKSEEETISFKTFKRHSILIAVMYITITVLLLCYQFSICVKSFHDEVYDIYQKSEIALQNCYAKMDYFILNVYSDSFLLSDFIKYFGNNAEEYLSSRLDNQNIHYKNSSFIKECEKFASENDNMINSITFRSDNTYNMISFSPMGDSKFDFKVSNKKHPQQEGNISQGFVYSKFLADPREPNKIMGRIAFTIRPEKIIKISNSYQKINIVASDTKNYVSIKSTDEIYVDYAMSTILSLNKNNIRSYGTTYPIQYITYNLSHDDVKIVGYSTAQSLILDNISSFLLTIGVCTMLTFAVLLYFYVKNKQDSEFISKIISSIQDAKSGQFVHTVYNKRNDEYGLIANELNDMSKKINKFIQKEYILKINQQETEMRALQNQINPHFLYNTLEIIRAQAIINNDENVSDAISSLGNLYRNIVKSENIITINKELSILNEYLKLMEIRYPSSFYYQTDFDEETLNLKTVKLWMQPLAENFIKHGMNQASEYNLLLIIGKAFTDCYKIEFIDNGKNIKEEKLLLLKHVLTDSKENNNHSTSGLANVASRLKKFYKDNVLIDINNNETAGVTITITIKK